MNGVVTGAVICLGVLVAGLVTPFAFSTSRGPHPAGRQADGGSRPIVRDSEAVAFADEDEEFDRRDREPGERRERRGRRDLRHERHPHHGDERGTGFDEEMHAERRKLEHLHQAAAHLREAGSDSLAEKVIAEAERRERKLQEEVERHHRRREPFGSRSEQAELRRTVDELREDVQRLSRELGEIRELLEEEDE